MTTNIDNYLVEGCMRCKYGGTPQCKVLNWVEELLLLREIVLETNLTEEMKWGVPVYTKNGKNIVTVNALKESAFTFRNLNRRKQEWDAYKNIKNRFLMEWG